MLWMARSIKMTPATPSVDIVGATGLQIDALVISDLEGYLYENDDRLVATNETLREGLTNTDDPAYDLLQTLVNMMKNYDTTTISKRASIRQFAKLVPGHSVRTARVLLMPLRPVPAISDPITLHKKTHAMYGLLGVIL